MEDMNRISGKHKITKSIFLILNIALLTLIVGVGAYAEDVNNFVDLHFTIDSQSYSSKGMGKELEVAPFIEDGTTLIPLRVVLEELGFTVDWDSSQNMITATQGNKQIKLQIGNSTALVNGVEQQLPVEPQIVDEKTVVPLRFMSESTGADVIWDDSTRSIYISKVGQYNTGTVGFYEESGNHDSKLYVYNGSDIKVIPLGNENITNWYTFHGKVIATLHDKIEKVNRVAIFDGDKFVTLVNNFEIDNTFEFNNNLIVSGYDDSQKFNKLYRFDGNSMLIIDNNFYIGQYFLFKDKLVINKYDNTRDYSLLVFDKGSWVPKLLSSDFIIKGNVEYNGVMYMTGLAKSGDEHPFASYDGNVLKMISSDVPIDINKFVPYNGKIYAIIDDENDGSVLKVIDNNSISTVEYRYWGDQQLNGDITAKLNLNCIKVYNNKLYFGVTGAKFISHNLSGLLEQSGALQKQIESLQSISDIGDSDSTQIQVDSLQKQIDSLQKQIDSIQKDLDNYNNQQINGGILETDGGAKFKVFISRNFPADEMSVINNKLIILAGQWLYAYDGSQLINTIDVVSIKQSIGVGNKVFLDVTDLDRLKGSDTEGQERNTVLLIDQSKITNLVTKNFEVKDWTELNGKLVAGGYEQSIDENTVYLYDSKFNKVLGNFEINYWNKVGNEIFACGSNSTDNTYKFARITNSTAVSLADGLEVTDMVKLNGSYYLVNAIVHKENSSLDGKKIIYLFDNQSNKFTEMKDDIEITKMIFIK